MHQQRLRLWVGIADVCIFSALFHGCFSEQHNDTCTNMFPSAHPGTEQFLVENIHRMMMYVYWLWWSVAQVSYIFNMCMYYVHVCRYMLYCMSTYSNMPCLREPVLKTEFLTHTDSEDQTRGLPQKKVVMGSQRWEASGKIISGVNFSPCYLHVYLLFADTRLQTFLPVTQHKHIS